jgi:hypothetical protein
MKICSTLKSLSHSMASASRDIKKQIRITLKIKREKEVAKINLRDDDERNEGMEKVASNRG